MNNPATAILDGLSVAGIHWRLVLGILLVLFVSQGSLLFLFHRIFGSRFNAGETVSLSLAGWLLPASLLSLLWYMAAGLVSTQSGNVVTGVLLVLGLLGFIRAFREMRSAPWVALSLLLLAGLFILLRLAFVSRAIVPLYFDSAQHYRFINEIVLHLETAGTASFEGYYHRGFHFLAAFVTSFTGANITDTMLVLGQVILALMPFSAFFLVRHGSGSSSAGFLALALAAFGWYMPAHAMDWGKYPALASLALIPFVLSLAYLSIQNRNVLAGKKYLGLNLLLLAGTLVSVFLHSRSLVIYALLALASVMTYLWTRLTKWAQLLLVGFLLLILIGEVVYIQSQGILGPLLDAYGRNAYFVTVPVLILSIFAWWAYPGWVFFCLASVALVLASMFVPLGDLIPGYAGTTLLDRPFVQMILYLPLSVLAGCGLAGLEQLLRGWTVGRENSWEPGKIIGSVLILLVTIHGLVRYDLYPSDCCAIVSQDDLAAIDWLDQNLPRDALILTSSTDLKVLPTDKYQGSAGGDAGTWITPITGRPVASLPFNTDFSQAQTLDLICQQNVRYVYVGKTGWFFNDAGMTFQPGDYRLLLDLPKARVYEVTGCQV